MSAADSCLARRLASRLQATVPCAVMLLVALRLCRLSAERSLHLCCCRLEQGRHPMTHVAHYCYVITGLLVCVQARLAGSAAPAGPAAPPLPSAGHKAPHAVQPPQLTPLSAPSLDPLLNKAPLGPQSSQGCLLRSAATERGSHTRLSCSRQTPRACRCGALSLVLTHLPAAVRPSVCAWSGLGSIVQ